MLFGRHRPDGMWEFTPWDPKFPFQVLGALALLAVLIGVGKFLCSIFGDVGGVIALFLSILAVAVGLIVWGFRHLL